MTLFTHSPSSNRDETWLTCSWDKVRFHPLSCSTRSDQKSVTTMAGISLSRNLDLKRYTQRHLLKTGRAKKASYYFSYERYTTVHHNQGTNTGNVTKQVYRNSSLAADDWLWVSYMIPGRVFSFSFQCKKCSGWLRPSKTALSLSEWPSPLHQHHTGQIYRLRYPRWGLDRSFRC